MPRVRWLLMLWTVALSSAVGGASCGSEDPIELCFVPGDEDGNGLLDCLDPACWRANVGCKEVCDDRPNDEDGDGDADCDDSDCWVKNGTCGEVCDGGRDEDGDGKRDCFDSDCWTKDGKCAELCKGGHDEDADDLVDCADDDCWVLGAGCAEECTGGHDEDGDAKTDCYDENCFGTPECTEVCTGGVDEDVDGLVDCADPECKKDLVTCPPGFDVDVKPLVLKYCAGQACHVEGIGAGGLIAAKYDDFKKNAIYCAGHNKGWCSAYRIKEGTMPKDCFNCLKPSEVDIIQAWVDGGLLP